MTTANMIGLGAIGLGYLALGVWVAVWAERDSRRRERARVEQYRAR